MRKKESEKNATRGGGGGAANWRAHELAAPDRSIGEEKKYDKVDLSCQPLRLGAFWST